MPKKEKREWRHTRIEGADVYQERVVFEEKLISEQNEEEKKEWGKYRQRNQKTGKIEPGSQGKKDDHVKGRGRG